MEICTGHYNGADSFPLPTTSMATSYGTSRPGQNLDRTATQLTLVAQIEAQWPELKAIVRAQLKIANKLDSKMPTKSAFLQRSKKFYGFK